MDRVLLFDTETTGFWPGQIGQLAYIYQERRQVVGKNHFFQVDYMPEEAVAVHGFSAARLQDLSEGRHFSDNASQIFDNFRQAKRLVAHNADFDCRFLITEFKRCGIIYQPVNVSCTMRSMRYRCGLTDCRGYNKVPRLEELVDFFGIPPSLIRDECRKIFGPLDIGAHDARFDVTATFLCFEIAVKRGYM